ncbi:MAG: hypothetical protein WCD20_04955 [Rhodomicrobium sp.]
MAVLAIEFPEPYCFPKIRIDIQLRYLLQADTLIARLRAFSYNMFAPPIAKGPLDLMKREKGAHDRASATRDEELFQKDISDRLTT